MTSPDDGTESERYEMHLSEVRHALRNRLAAIQNASFYIRKKVALTDLLEKDARMKAFFELIDQELVKADTLVRETLTSRALAGSVGQEEARTTNDGLDRAHEAGLGRGALAARPRSPLPIRAGMRIGQLGLLTVRSPHGR